jgi:uncharacterized protein YutD
MKTILTAFLVLTASCNVVAYISEYANFERSYYVIDKIEGNKTIEIFPEITEKIEYQIIEGN